MTHALNQILYNYIVYYPMGYADLYALRPLAQFFYIAYINSI